MALELGFLPFSGLDCDLPLAARAGKLSSRGPRETVLVDSITSLPLATTGAARTWERLVARRAKKMLENCILKGLCGSGVKMERRENASGLFGGAFSVVLMMLWMMMLLDGDAFG